MAEQPDTPRTDAHSPRNAVCAPQEKEAAQTPQSLNTQSSNTHSLDTQSVAIALNSKGGQAQATQVIAKGTGEVAEQILQLAFEHGVKVRSDADLATILSAVEVESEIPLEALTAVANILSYIYRAEQPSSPESSS